MELTQILGDRRMDNRYEIGLDLTFTYRSEGGTMCGTGRTTDLSRGGVRFTTDSLVPDGVDAELNIAWPFLLQDVIPLTLVMPGKVLKTDERGTVMEAVSYAFRTCGRQGFHDPAPSETTCCVSA
jgi:hypothetical protein